MAKDYQTFDMFDFITDESFKSWVLNPTTEQDDFWQHWISSHPNKADEVNRAREFILSIKYQKREDLKNRKAAIYDRVIEQSKKAAIKGSVGRFSFSLRKSIILRVVASITLLLALSLFVLYQSGKKKPLSQESEAVTYEMKMTKRGEKLTLMLPDGSMVKLNAESSLKYAKSFAAQREVYLQGEAYFEVEQDSLHPFKVKAGGVDTEVLGTSFNVNQSAKDSMVQVAVTSGKVVVTSQHGNERYYLLPTEVLTYKPSKVTKCHFDEELLLGWKDGILAFENASMEEIARRLSAWYDVDFEIRGQTNVERKFSGKFKKRSLRQILEGISFASNFEFRIQQDKVLIDLK